MAKNLKKAEEVAKEVIGVIKNLDITDAQKVKKSKSKKENEPKYINEGLRMTLRNDIKDPEKLKLKPVKPKKPKAVIPPIPFSHQPPQVVLKPGTPGYVKRIKKDWELEKEKRDKILRQADVRTLTKAEIVEQKAAVAAQREKEAAAVHLNSRGAVEYTLEKYYNPSNKGVWNSLDQIAARPLDPLNQTLFQRRGFTDDHHSIWGLNNENLQNRTPFRFASDSHSIDVGNSDRTNLTQTQLDTVVMKDTIARMFLKLHKLDPRKGALFHSMYPTWEGGIERLYNNIKYMDYTGDALDAKISSDKAIKATKAAKSTK